MRYGLRPLGGAMVCWWCIAATAYAASTSPPIPPFDQVEDTVEQYFEKLQDYQPGDLITQDQVEPLLKKLQEQGFPLEMKKILALTPSQKEFFVRQLSTPQGRRFMRRVAKYPDGFDRVDRLSRLPQGHQTVRMLVNDPQGNRMIEYMTTSRGGIELGKMLSRDPGGANFNAPTGRLYTVALLLDELKKVHAAAVKAAEKNDKT